MSQFGQIPLRANDAARGPKAFRLGYSGSVWLRAGSLGKSLPRTDTNAAPKTSAPEGGS